MQILDYLKDKNIKIYKRNDIGINHYTCVYSEGENKYFGFGKGFDEKKNLCSAIGECLERKIYRQTIPDEISKSSTELIYDTIQNHGYFSSLQLKNGIKYKEWDSKDVQNWLLMNNLDGDKIYAPYEGSLFNSPYFRASSSGWSVGEGDNSIIGSILECVERDAIIKAWLYNDFGYDLTKYNLNYNLLEPFNNLGINCRVFLIKNIMKIPCVLIWFYIDSCKDLKEFSNGSFFSTACGSSIESAFISCIDGGYQKLSWVKLMSKGPGRRYNENINHRLEALNKNFSDMLFQDFKYEKIQSDSHLNDFLPYTYHIDLPEIKRRADKHELQVLFKKKPLDLLKSNTLTITQSIVVGLMQNSYGHDYELPLYYLNDKKVKEVLSEKRKFRHPFS